MDRYDPRDVRDPRLFRQAIDQARTRYVPGLVLAEVDYFLRERAMEVDRRFADLGLGLVDASVVALWPSRWASVDWRHATRVTSPLFDSVMVVRLSSSYISDRDNSGSSPFTRRAAVWQEQTRGSHLSRLPLRK